MRLRFLTDLEILCIGNELLIGRTINTNAHWLAKRITNLGLNVKRITVVSDDVDEIALTVKEAIQRNPSYIITTGGLGPTFDDKTLEGVAKVLGKKLEVNKEAFEMIKERYESYVAEGRIEKCEMTPLRVKMAKLPKGSKPLSNPVGTAPGVLIVYESVNLVMLPGIPQEMIAIFDGSVETLLRKAAGDVTFYELNLYIRGISESELAPTIDKVMHDNAYVYIKSHPKTVEKEYLIELHFSTTSKDQKIARQRIAQSIAQISEIITEKGGKTQPAKVQFES